MSTNPSAQLVGVQGFGMGRGFSSLLSDSQEFFAPQNIKLEGIRSSFPFSLPDTKVGLI